MTTPGPDPASLHAIIRAMNQAFCAALRAGDVETMVNSFYAEEARVLPPDHPILSGKAQIRDFMRAMIASGVKDLSLDTEHIESSGDLAYEVGRYTMKLGDAVDRGKYVVVFGRQPDGSWRAVADMFSSNGQQAS